jgi:mRNA interferase MazF
MVKQGDIIWLDSDSPLGRKQKGRQLVLVVSNEMFNSFSRSAIVCPIINTNGDYPFHIKLDKNMKTTGVVLCDHPKRLDINARNCEFIETVPENILFEAVDIINGFIEIAKKEK